MGNNDLVKGFADEKKMIMMSILRRLAVSSATAEVCCVRTFTTSNHWSQKVCEKTVIS